MIEGIGAVGFIGLGDMGAKQAHLIARLPLTLTVFDVRASAMAPFEGKATQAASVAEAGEGKDLVGICVQTEDQVISCVDALIPVMRSGAVILIHATIGPDAVRAIADKAAVAGIEVADAPVTRTRPGEDAPFVFCPFGGTAELKARVQPYLDSFATDTLLTGALGSAMALKICNNLLSWCEISVGMEAFRLAESAGVSAETLIKLIGTNGILTPPMRFFEGFRSNTPSNPEWRTWLEGAAAQGEKDLKLALSLARKGGVDTPVTDFASTVVKASVLSIAGD